MELSEFIINKIECITPSAFIIFCIFLFFIINWLISKKDFFIETWNKFYEHRKHKEEFFQMLIDDHKRIKEYEENRIHDREQSFQIQKQLIDANANLAEKLESMSQKIDANQKLTDERFAASEESSKQRIRAELKDKLLRAYRQHHAAAHISSMELEAMSELIEVYSQNGGNSFVHEIIVPEMYTWEVVDE